MLLSLLKRVVKATLHQATEEWLLETGLSKEMIDELRAQRDVIVHQTVARADEMAARRLDVDDDLEVHTDVPALPMPAALQAAQPSEGEGDLMEWVHTQRQANVGWSEIAQVAAQKGFQGSEDALRQRYKRWREKQADNTSPSA